MTENILARLTGTLASMNIKPVLADLSARIIIGITILLLAVLLWLITRKVVTRIAGRILRKLKFSHEEEILKTGIFHGIAITIPSLAIWYTAPVFLSGLSGLLSFVKIAALLAIIMSITRTIISTLDFINFLYTRREDSRRRPIKGLVQAVKVLLVIGAFIISISVIIRQPISGLLAGLGAFSAVVMFVFKDMLMGLVSGFQISGNDMVRIGDWIEVPSHGADGDVIDISLLNVTVQNWDKTWITFPIQALTTGGFKNWRGMNKAGGRRIKRSLNIDMSSIRFLDAQEIEKLESIEIIREFLTGRDKEIQEYNQKQKINRDSSPVNGRAMTNIGVFREYAKAYIRSHPDVNTDLTLLVRQLQSTDAGLPLELYFFSSDTSWINYEGIQSDVFDHLFASLGEFGLKAFQQPSGNDIRSLVTGQKINADLAQS